MKKENHLKGQSSPYLLQHLHNPVDWHPWGEDALEKARRENKPLLISIGYSACHWCHVMERESFEDIEVAGVMNRHFVCIKVDREERPDVDHLYMNAVQMVAGHGGWPLNCFALPDGRPFWGGTYFRKDQWLGILERVAELFGNNFQDVLAQAENLTKGVASASFVNTSEDQAVFGRQDVNLMYDNLMSYMDKTHGGTRGAPKFPLPNNLVFLLHFHELARNQEGLEQVRLGLTKMAYGGIYDQLGGGFARYATDDRWKVPHFEKMLYDNGQLVSVYSQAFKVTADPLFKDVVYETIAFVERELKAPEGTFYAALDADSEGEEGRYYVWTAREFEAVLGAEASLVGAYYQLGQEGLWENEQNILLRKESASDFAKRHDLDEAVWSEVLSLAREKLLKARFQRVRPGLDDKRIVSWNALMIQGLADAWSAFGEPRFLQLARDAADFILRHAMTPEGRLYRTMRGQQVSIHGFLEDYAFLSMALIRLYEVSAGQEYLMAARKLSEYVLKHFQLPDTRLFAFSSGEAGQLASPHFEFHDNVMPASNSVMAKVLFYLAHYYEVPQWGERSSHMLTDLKERLDKYSSSFSNWGTLLLHHVYPFYTVVLTGEKSMDHLRELNRYYLPQAIMAAGTTREPLPDDESDLLPVFRDRFTKGRSLIHVCAMGHCKRPVETAKEALVMLGESKA